MKKISRYCTTQKFIHPILAICLSTVLFFSCGKGDSLQDDSDYFTFDKSLHGIEVVDQELGIKYFPPKNWELQQSMISKKTESRDSSNPNDKFIYSPTYVFFDDSTGGFLSVGKVVTSDTMLAKGARLNFYKGLISSKYKNESLIIGNFIHSKIYFSQIKFEKYNLVSFKLLFLNANNEILEFDYTIPSKFFEGTEPSIKSSIGSIRLQ